MGNDQDGFISLADYMGQWALQAPERRAFTFLKFTGRSSIAEESSLTFARLHGRVTALARVLTEAGLRGERAVLLFTPGLEFVVAFHACLYAGVVAVPCPAPRQGFGLERVRSILADCTAKSIVSTRGLQAQVDGEAIPSGTLWIAVDDIGEYSGSPLPPQAFAPESLALLQYSSGSTGTPKGVMISHGNLIRQSAMLAKFYDVRAEHTFVTWLPHFHDLGLVTAVVLPTALGMHSVLMSPDAFVQQPARWLRALGKYGAAHCASPDFAYELCARKVSDEDLASIDLSRLQFAITGAEPVRAATLEAFSRRFAGTGFNGRAFRPAYGLAEATLVVSGGVEAKIAVFDAGSLDGRTPMPVPPGTVDAVRLVSAGRPCDADVRIVDPESGVELAQGQVGEIWVANGSVGLGYWGSDAELQSAFRGRLADGNPTHYLRTGDLGFLHGGDLYVRGRIKDLILVHGTNHYAPDLEATVAASHPLFETCLGAAFSVDDGEGEHVVIVQEVPRDARSLSAEVMEQASVAIREKMMQVHQIAPKAIVLVIRSIPRTSSGKVRRGECRLRYLAGELKPLHVCQMYSKARTTQGDSASDEPSARPTGDRGPEFERWLVEALACRIGVPAERLTSEASLRSLGLNTTVATSLLREFEKAHGWMVPLSEFLEQDTVSSLAAYLAQQGAGVPSGSGAGRRLSADELVAGMRVSNAADASGEEIAIVGMSCRFPLANDIDEFWSNLCAGVDAVTDIPPDRWDRDALYDENPLALGKMNTRRGGFIRDVELFDRKFFNVPAREATRMDPAHRLLLHVSWEAFEDAGIAPSAVDGRRVGVFVGISGSDYAQLQFGDDLLSDPYAGVGCALTNSASRISHFLNLRGPALAVDTACSSSLSALHLACQAIRSGDCEMALAGGVNIILSPTITMSLSKAGMMAPDGRCKAFDKSADGYVRSEGVGVVLVKSLKRALADGDHIHAVIRGSASNQDGRSSGISAPNGEAQQRVVMAACESARLLPGQLDYIEAHGTGTAVGDPIEVNALGEVLKIGAEPGKRFAIGSVKTAIGHAESAAGMASVIKAALVAQHRLVPPNLHFIDPNPLIPFDQHNIDVQRELAPLGEAGTPVRVGVNSFGIGGTNVHVGLEQPPARQRPAVDGVAPARRPMLLPLSAKGERALKANARAVRDFLREAPEGVRVEDLCYSLSACRQMLDNRVVVIGSNVTELTAALESVVEGGYHVDVVASHGMRDAAGQGRVAFVFSGQGTQWWGMGRALMRAEPVYREAIERCDAALQPHTGWSLIELLDAPESASRLNETVHAQPALFALQYSLCALLQSWRITPDAVVGHSLGEVAAACMAGALSLEDACRLIAIRGRLMQEVTGQGLMASLELSRADALRELEPYAGRLTIAASNGPATTVVSGDTESLHALIADLNSRGIDSVALPVSYAFHSHQMEETKRELVGQLAFLTPTAPALPFASTVTGRWVNAGAMLDAVYWGDNVREEVRFVDAIETLASDGYCTFVEIGPHPTLAGLVRRTLREQRVDVLPTLEREIDDQRAMVKCVAGLHVLQHPPSWQAFYPGATYVRGLPHYQWDSQRYWMDAPHHEARNRISTHPLVTVRMPTALATWASHLDINVNPYLHGVRIRGKQRLCTGLLLELAGEAGSRELGARPEFADIELAGPVGVLDSGLLPSLQASVGRDASGSLRPMVHAQSDASRGKAESWYQRLECRVVEPRRASRPRNFDPSLLTSRYGAPLPAAEVYRKLSEVGVEYDRSCQVATQIWMDDESAVVELNPAPWSAPGAERYFLHPLVFEAVEQAARLASGSRGAQGDVRAIRRIRHFGSVQDVVLAFARCRGADQASAVCASDVWLLDAAGNVVVAIEGLTLVADSRIAEVDSSALDSNQWRYRASWKPDPMTEGVSLGLDRGAWLVVADAAGSGVRLADSLAAAGQKVVLARPGRHYTQEGDRLSLNPGSVADLERALNECFTARGLVCRGVVHLGAMDCTGDESEDRARAKQAAFSLVCVLQAITRAELVQPPRLWVATRGAQSVLPEESPAHLGQALVWGSMRSITIEHAELRCSRIDLDPTDADQRVDPLMQELLADRVPDQVAIRGEQRYVLQLNREAPPEALDSLVSRHGLLVDDAETCVPANLATPRRRLASGEVELRVLEADVSGWSREVLADEGVRLQPVMRQLVGRVVRIGHGVSGLAEGDRVFALSDSPLASHEVVPASVVVPWPEVMSACGAVASIRAGVASLMAMREIADVRRGTLVLLRLEDPAHGAVAIQVAKALGAKVFVAISSAHHSELTALRPEHVFDETEPSVFEDVRAMSGGQGVDVLINFARNLGDSSCAFALRPLGRCVDLAASTPAEVGLLHSRLPANVSFHPLDLAARLADQPDEAKALLADVVEQVRGGILRPHDCTPLDLDALIRAAERPYEPVGVVQLSEPADAAADHLAVPYRPDGTYLITGGLGGLGLKIAERIVQDGGRHLVLLGRREPSLAAVDALAALEAQGATCRTFAIDVADEGAVARMLEAVRASMPPLAGIFHAAGVLDNGLASLMDESQFDSVMPSKVDGAWHLDALTRDDTLDFFVLFSSLASMIGSPGQSNYAGANAYLEALAARRVAEGRHGLAIAWGPWAEAGMAADGLNLLRLEHHGVGMIPLDEGLDVLGALVLERAQGTLGVMPISWPVWAQSLGHLARTPYFSAVVPEADTGAATYGRLTVAVLSSMPVEQRVERIQDAILLSLCQAMMLDAASVEPDVPLTALGLDSIVALELKGRIESQVDVVVRTGALIGGRSIRALAQRLHEEMFAAAGSEPDTPAGAAEQELLEGIEELSQEEIETMLMALEDEPK